jgi:hypothetical protein
MSIVALQANVGRCMRWRIVLFAILPAIMGASLHAEPAKSDLSLLTWSAHAPSFAQVLDARFADPADERFESYRAWAQNIGPEERERWYQQNGVGADGKPRWKVIVPCGSLDSRGLARAMIAAAEKAPDRAAAERNWQEVQRAYAAAPLLERDKLAAARMKARTRRTPVGVELANRVARDQAWREAQFSRHHDAATAEAIGWRFGSHECHVDADNLQWLRQIMADGKWPLISRDGKDSAEDAWLLVQHADDDPEFQRQVLAFLAPLVARKEAIGKDYALLFDRVATANGQPQRYATQFTQGKDGCLTALSTEDPAHIEERRAGVGLSTLLAYARKLSHAYHMPVCTNLFESPQQ